MNIIYFGYDLFYTCLEYLILQKDINILKVYSFECDKVYDFNDKISEICTQNNIPFTTEKITAKEIKKQFDNGCNLVFSAGYAHKIPVDAAKNFVGVNVHPSLLPIGKGSWPFPHIILRGHKESGVTIHKLAENFDNGDIILQEKYDVSENDSIYTLEDKSRECALNLTKRLFSDFDFLYENAKPQEKGQYWKEPDLSEYVVYSDTPESEKMLKIRAFGKKNLVFYDKNKGE